MDDKAVATVWSFQIAAVIFIAGLTTVLVTTNSHDSGEDAVSQSSGERGAEQLLSLLAGRPGVWSDIDAPERVGLGAANRSGLDPARLGLLLNASDTASINGVLDHSEAYASLLAEGIDGEWHLRIRPLAGTLELQSIALEGGRIGYIGAWDDLASITIDLGTPEEMMAQAQDEIDLAMLLGTDVERNLLSGIGMQFNDQVIITTDVPSLVVDLPWPLPDIPLLDQLGITLIDGDVYPADRDYMEDVLVPRLGQYDVLVIGSDVDGGTFTPDAIKSAIKDWVEAGGQLMVLGSDAHDPQWMQPLFHISEKSDSGTPTAPSPLHDLLNDPNTLSWSQFPTTGNAWEVPQTGANAAYDDFEHVITIDDRDTWAVSEPGFTGAGRVMLTSYRGHEIESTLGEGAEFFDNSIRYLFADLPAYLFLDYGTAIPDDRPVGGASLRTHVWTPVGLVPVEMELLRW